MKKNMLIISAGKGYGGAEKSIELVIKNLKNKFNILVGVSDEKLKKNLIEDQINIFSLKNSKLFIIYNIFILFFKVRKYDIIIANTNKDAFYLAILSIIFNLSRKNILVYMRDHQWKFRKFIFKSLKNAKYILPTETLLEDNNYMKKYLNKDQLYVIEEAVDLKNVSFKMGKYILILANISRLKGIDLLLKAYVNSNVIKDNIKLIICGKVQDDIYFKEILMFITKNKLEPFVEIRDFQDDYQKDILYRNSLMVINSSISEYGGPETFGRTIIEAWSYKKPVISFNVGGPKYIIDNGINGFLVEEKNIKELSEKISLLSNNRNLCKIFGENGYNKVILKYTVEIIIKKLLKYLNEKYI